MATGGIRFLLRIEKREGHRVALDGTKLRCPGGSAQQGSNADQNQITDCYYDGYFD